MKPGTQHDLTLWNDFIGGNQEAFRRLYEQYADRLYSFGLKYTGDRELLKDCIHDLFVDLHRYRATLSKKVSVWYYLLKSYKRKVHAGLKRNGQAPQPAFSHTYSPEDSLISSEEQQHTLRALAREVNRLPDRQKEALYLKFNCDLEYEEAASLMKVSVPTCRTLVYRAIRQLRQNLRELPTHQVLLLLFRHMER